MLTLWRAIAFLSLAAVGISVLVAFTGAKWKI